MNRPDKFITIILQNEGGYVNDPDDKGGETYRGISRVNHPEWSGWHKLDAIKDKKKGFVFKELSNDVISFYKKNYYDRFRIDYLYDELLAMHVFDMCITSGRAIKLLQEVLKVTVDGAIGNQTIEAANANKLAASLFIAKRKEYYTSLNQPKYINGWLNRVDKTTKELKRLSV